MAEPTPLLDAIAVRRDPDHPGRWRSTVPDTWATPNGMHGGVLAAVLINAARAELDDPELRLRSAHISFRAVPSSYELVIEPVVARRGGITAHLDVTIGGSDQAGGSPAASGQVLFTRDRPSASYLDGEQPAAPPVDELAAGPAPGTAIFPPGLGRVTPPAIFDHLELVGVEGRYPWEPGWVPGPARHLRWARYRAPIAGAESIADGSTAEPAAGPDPILLVPLSDFPAAALWVKFGLDQPFHFVTSLEYSISFLELPQSEIVLTDIRARSMADGYLFTETDLWCEGRLVAVSTQTMLVRSAPALESAPPG